VRHGHLGAGEDRRADEHEDEQHADLARDAIERAGRLA
jgi:hypothetical protein